MYALIDSNNFFVSCERIFRPDLQDVPVIVLSSNDGCAVARSNEAKALGIKMGEPLHELKHRFTIINSTLPYVQHRHERWPKKRVHSTSDGREGHRGRSGLSASTAILTPEGRARLSSDYDPSRTTPQLVTFSANFELYGDISRRIASTLARITPRIELYSIDEAFVDISDLDIADYTAWGRTIAATIRREIGVPVSVGIAPTKTLCKLATDYAKNHGACQSAFYIETRDMRQEVRKTTPRRSEHGGISCQADNDRHIVETVRSTGASEKRAVECGLSASTAMLTPEEEQAPLKDRKSLLATTPVQDIWGIGWRLAPRLKAEGIHTALDLARMPPKRAQQLMGIQGRRTVAELGGTMCIPLSYAHKPQQVISRGRQFGRDSSDFDTVAAATARMANHACLALRREGLLATRATIWLSTNRKKPDYTVFHRDAFFYTPTADTGRIIHQLLTLLQHDFDDGHAWHKAEVTLWNLIPDTSLQTDIFGLVNPRQHAHSAALMTALDSINHKHGKGTLHYAAEDLSQTWRPRCKQMSPSYTTSWAELPVLRATQPANARSG